MEKSCVRDRSGQSMASLVWREQVNELLAAMIAHLKELGLYDRVVAFQIGSKVQKCCSEVKRRAVPSREPAPNRARALGFFGWGFY